MDYFVIGDSKVEMNLAVCVHANEKAWRTSFLILEGKRESSHGLMPQNTVVQNKFYKNRLSSFFQQVG